MKSKLEELKSFKTTCSSQIFDLNRSAKEVAQKRFEENGGCERCRGRGWVVTWDTLDCMQGSYAEYAGCDTDGCTHETRLTSGYYPENTKYDRNRGTQWYPEYTEEQAKFKQAVENQIRKLDRDIRTEEIRWSVSPGKVVRVTKEGRGPKARRVPVGTEGLVKKLHTNDWGTTKAIVVDEKGNQWWPNLKQITVIDPEPDMSEWHERDMKTREKNGYPIVITIKKKTGRACLVKTTTSREIWIPFSQVPELKTSREKQTLSVSVPMWIAEKNGLVVRDS